MAEMEAEAAFDQTVGEEIDVSDLLDKSMTPEERERQKIREEIERLIDESPESAVQVLKTWLIEEQR